MGKCKDKNKPRKNSTSKQGTLSGKASSKKESFSEFLSSMMVTFAVALFNYYFQYSGF